MKAIVAGVLVCLLLVACSHSQVSPAAGLDTKEMCIVENARVHSDFLRAYQQALRDKGYSTKVLPPNSPFNACPVVSTYSARWSVEIPFVYLQSAELYVYRDGRPAGRALFQADHSGFFTTDGKVRELVTKLYP